MQTASSTTPSVDLDMTSVDLDVNDLVHSDGPQLLLDDLLGALRAAGEPTRLRILAVLAQGELTVSELCRILGQTQPRVSRHLKLLGEAGLLARHAEGTSAFFRPTRDPRGRRVLDSILPLLDPDDGVLAADRERLGSIRAERAEVAAQYFEQIAGDWEQIRALHVADDQVERAMLTAADDHRIGDRRIATLLDIGTGTGRVLELFADRISRGLGIDLSSNMLNLARSNLTTADHDHCSVRHGNIYALDVAPHSFDLAVLHHVLHFLDEPSRAIASAAGALAPGGQLIVVDFAPHSVEALRTDFAHRRLGFADHEIERWCRDAGFTDVVANHLRPPAPDSDPSSGPVETGQVEPLTVTVWTAIQGVEGMTEALAS